MKILNLKTEKEWLKARKEVVTATEASVLLGVNRWTSPNKMVQEKYNSTFKGNAYTKLGQFLEPVVVNLTNEVLKTKFTLLETEEIGKIFYMDSKIGLGATPDATNGRVFLECKTTKPLNFIKYSSSPPLYYICQVMVQMFCADMKESFISIMSTDLTQHRPEPNWPIVIFKVTRSKKLDQLLIQEVERFWRLRKEDKKFRVDSKVKTLAKLLLSTSFKRIY